MIDRQPNRGFTIVELLVVIAIIVVLIAMLLPALNKARQQANLLKCQSNLRQIGIAFEMYTLNNGGWLPMASTPFYTLNNSANGDNPYYTNWSLLLTAAINGGTGMANDSDFVNKTLSLREGLFHDSDTPDLPNGDSDTLDYSTHPRLIPNMGYGPAATSSSTDYYQSAHLGIAGAQYPLYKLVRIQNPQYIVLAGDAAVCFAADGADASAGDVDGAMVQSGAGYLVNTTTTQYFYNSPFNAGPNTDCVDYQSPPYGDFRFRHMNQTEANFLFADLHVEARHYRGQYGSELSLTNFVVNLP